jgi:hypothetical protein
MSWLYNLREKPEVDTRSLRNKKHARAAVNQKAPQVPPPLYQVDPKITRSELIGAHTKWLLCTSAFWVRGDQCEVLQPYVPKGYWFETGRPSQLPPPGLDCYNLTGNEPEVPVVKNCRIKKGLTMVLPVLNSFYVACDTPGSFEDPRKGSESVSTAMHSMSIVKATLDGKPISSLDAIYIQTQDGDADYRLATDSFCTDHLEIFDDYGGCPLYASGPYVFLKTTELSAGSHELILIGTWGFCAAVKHQFTIY